MYTTEVVAKQSATRGRTNHFAAATSVTSISNELPIVRSRVRRHARDDDRVPIHVLVRPLETIDGVRRECDQCAGRHRHGRDEVDGSHVVRARISAVHVISLGRIAIVRARRRSPGCPGKAWSRSRRSTGDSPLRQPRPPRRRRAADSDTFAAPRRRENAASRCTWCPRSPRRWPSRPRRRSAARRRGAGVARVRARELPAQARQALGDVLAGAAWQTQLAGQTLPELLEVVGSSAVSPQAGVLAVAPHATNSSTTTAQANPGHQFHLVPLPLSVLSHRSRRSSPVEQGARQAPSARISGR